MHEWYDKIFIAVRCEMRWAVDGRERSSFMSNVSNKKRALSAQSMLISPLHYLLQWHSSHLLKSDMVLCSLKAESWHFDEVVRGLALPSSWLGWGCLYRNTYCHNEKVPFTRSKSGPLMVINILHTSPLLVITRGFIFSTINCIGITTSYRGRWA